MSPRSNELYERAERRLQTARLALDAGDPSAAVSLAYYAMLFAARAALSEEDQHARTHRGTWYLFRERLVKTGRVERELGEAPAALQGLREDADYGADIPSGEKATTVIDTAGRFLTAVRDAVA